MFSNSLDSVVFITFVINLFIATFLMARKYFTNQNKIPPELKKLLYRLFSVQTSVTFGMHIQTPYKYQLYLENGLTHSSVNHHWPEQWFNKCFYNCFMFFRPNNANDNAMFPRHLAA